MSNQLKAGAVLSYVALVVSSIVSMVYTPVMLQLLGQSEYGLYSLAISAAGYITILNFGLGNAVIRYTAKYKALNDTEGCSNLYGMFLIMYALLGAAALLIGIVLSLYAPDVFAGSLSEGETGKLLPLMMVSVINIAVGIGFGLFSVLLLAHERFIFQRVLSIISSIVSPLITLPFLLWGYGSLAVITLTAVFNVLTIAVNMFYCFKVLRIKITFRRFDRGLLKEILGFSFFILLNLLIEKIYWSTDQIILGIYTGTVAISIYTIGASFSGYFSGFATAISNVFLSKVTNMVTKETPIKEISDLFIRIGRLQYIIISFALSGFIIFGQEFIVLWVGEEYRSSYLIALLILVPMVLTLIQSMGGVILQAKNMQRFQSMVYLAVAVANVFLSILFVQWWGAVGCALATAAAFIVGNIMIMNMYYWKKIKLDIPKFWGNIALMSVPLAASLLIGPVINRMLIADSWWLFGLKAAVFSLLYLSFLWLVGMNSYEKELLRAPVLKIAGRLGKEKTVKVGS
jgi:O-antigen/teichoic acid export membrane protein